MSQIEKVKKFQEVFFSDLDPVSALVVLNLRFLVRTASRWGAFVNGNFKPKKLVSHIVFMQTGFGG